MRNVKTWDSIVDWGNVLPPSRPASWQLETARKVLRTRRLTDPVAVLGSTPEFCDLLAEMNFKKVYVFEKNLQFNKLMRQFRCYKSREEIVVGDWLRTLPDFRNAFCVILSDLTSGNLPYEVRDDFYRNISRSLQHDGLFIDKILTHPIPHETIASLEDEFAELPLNLETINRFSCRFFFCSELLNIRTEVDSSLFYQVLRNRLSKPRLKIFLKWATLITPPKCHWWYGRTWSKLRISYFRNLKTVEHYSDQSNSPYAGRCRLYLTVRR